LEVGDISVHVGTAIFLIFLIWLFIAVPAFRTLILGIIGLGAVALLVFIMSNAPSTRKQLSPEELTKAQERERAEEAAELRASTLIPLDQVSISQPLLKRLYGEDWVFSGVILNSSPYILTGATFEVTVRDCTLIPSCPIVAQRTAAVTPHAGVPAGQGRSFSQDVVFPGIPATSGSDWSYTIKSTRAR